MKITENFFLTAIIVSALCSTKSFGQGKDTTGKFTFSGYVDAYYAYYTDSLGGVGSYQKFPSISAKSNAFGLNTAQITAQYDADKVRGIVTLHYGDIAKSAWSPLFNNIMEAHAGIRLSKKLWLDAGFFRTHIGAEGLLPKENFTSSVSVTTFYEPYYESGARLNYNPNEKLSINLFLLNGYNIYEDNNNSKSFGMLVTYALGDKGSIGYNNYIGDDTPSGADTINHSRSYHNVFVNYTIKKLKIQLGLDFATQKNSDYTNGTETAAMNSGLLALKYQLKEKVAVYGRGEFFNDPQGFMSGVIIDRTGKYTGLKSIGGTFGIEYKPTDNTYLRIEGRQIQMQKDQDIFVNNGHTINRRELLINLGISF